LTCGRQNSGKRNLFVGKNNRVVKLEAMVHTGGSINFRQHLKNMLLIFSFSNNIYNFLIILICCIHIWWISWVLNW